MIAAWPFPVRVRRAPHRYGLSHESMLEHKFSSGFAGLGSQWTAMHGVFHPRLALLRQGDGSQSVGAAVRLPPWSLLKGVNVYLDVAPDADTTGDVTMMY